MKEAREVYRQHFGDEVNRVDWDTIKAFMEQPTWPFPEDENPPALPLTAET